MKKIFAAFMAVACLCTAFAVPTNAIEDPLPELFQEALDFLDWGYDYNEEYMIRTVNEEFSKVTEGYSYGDTLVINADEYEAMLHKRFVIDDAILENIRNSPYLVYDKDARTYTSSYLGSGMGGWLREREYLEYIQNGDTYDVYYGHITYQYLRDVLPEGITEDEYVNNVWNGTVEYDGIEYTGSFLYGYYAIISRDNYGRKYTVELTEECVRIVSCEEYANGISAITVSDSTGCVGKTVDVTVDLDKNSGITGAILKIDYDSKFKLLNVTTGEALSSLTFAELAVPYLNPLVVSWDGISDDKSNGILLTLTFEIPENMEIGEYPITVSYVEGNVYDENLDNVILKIDNGSINVIDITYGDVNGDGVINGKDLTLVRRHITGGFDLGAFTEAAADVNLDGVINGKDLTLIRRFITGGFGVELGK